MPHQGVPQPVAGAQRRQRRPVQAVLVAGPVQEGGPFAGGQPARLGVDGGEVVDHAAEDHRPPPLQLRVGVEEGEDPVVLVEDVEVPVADGAEDRALPPLPVVDADPVEHRDRLGAHQGREGPGGVLVVARREGEAGPLDEVAAVRLVPHHHQQPQQAGAFGEGEDLRVALVQLGGELVAQDLARQVGAGVVEDEDLGAVGLLDPVREGVQRVRGERVVPVEEEHVLPGGPRQPGVARPAEPPVLRQMDRHHPPVARRVRVDQLPAAVRRAVVHRDHLQVAERLAEHRVQAGAEVRLHTVGGHDHTEPGHGTSDGSTRVLGPTAPERAFRRAGYAECGIRGNRRGDGQMREGRRGRPVLPPDGPANTSRNGPT